MDEYWIIFLLPIFWWVLNISYQILSLFYLWIKYKLENIKELIR
jgi:hypothetical protein